MYPISIAEQTFLVIKTKKIGVEVLLNDQRVKCQSCPNRSIFIFKCPNYRFGGMKGIIIYQRYACGLWNVDDLPSI